MEDIRTGIQQNVIDMYTKDPPNRATLVLSTGFGKSRVALEVIKKISPEHIYIAVNSTDLRDRSWKTEFKKWNASLDWDTMVTIATYQKLARATTPISLPENSLVIFDEVDFVANTDVLSKVIGLFPNNRILGLTGFITESKKDWFAEHLPILTELSAAHAQTKGILNKLHFVFVKYNLSTNDDDITVTYKRFGETKTFTQSENSAYDFQNKKYITSVIAKGKLEEQFENGDMPYYEYEKLMKDLDYKITYAVKERSEVLLNSKATANIARKLLKHIDTLGNTKTIVFSMRTAQSERICGPDRVYNGTMKKRELDARFDSFNSGEINVLGTCDKINRGVNIEKLDNAIFETFYGSDTKATQRFGRLMRLSPDKVATAYILLPYYLRGEKDKSLSEQRTQQVTWAESMLRSTDVTSSTVWDYRTIKANN